MEKEISGIRMGTKAASTRNQPKVKDWNAEKVSRVLAEIKAACLTKATNRKWGKRKTEIHLQNKFSMTVHESQIQWYCDLFLCDLEEETLPYKSTELENHWRCVTHEELIKLLQDERKHDHRHAETCYSSLHEKYYPAVHETIIALYKQFVKGKACERPAPLPKTSLVQRMILATSPNSYCKCCTLYLKVYSLHYHFKFCIFKKTCWERPRFLGLFLMTRMFLYCSYCVITTLSTNIFSAWPI